MAEPQPKEPNRTPSDAPRCDMELPRRALAHRMDRQLMTLDDFGRYNVSVWRLENNGHVEYVVAHNQTIAELEKKQPRKRDNPAKVGLHAEGLVVAEIHSRRDILRGETIVAQLFTERIPCSECRMFLSAIPSFRSVPKYYYLAYHDKAWQKAQAGSWAAFLMDCYRLR